ncbi:translation initiation factor IF-2-like [Monodelphis domestica]|uniref:translation initiation factor IF-2-like n=1 Tax=Monodelphis domestica TaxID=13616 RepID=UPI0024E1AFE1|nr:translation initiation factor IF-2-like [Monodelphis domestica]
MSGSNPENRSSTGPLRRPPEPPEPRVAGAAPEPRPRAGPAPGRRAWKGFRPAPSETAPGPSPGPPSPHPALGGPPAPRAPAAQGSAPPAQQAWPTAPGARPARPSPAPPPAAGPGQHTRAPGSSPGGEAAARNPAPFGAHRRDACSLPIPSLLPHRELPAPPPISLLRPPARETPSHPHIHPGRPALREAEGANPLPLHTHPSSPFPTPTFPPGPHGERNLARSFSRAQRGVKGGGPGRREGRRAGSALSPAGRPAPRPHLKAASAVHKSVPSRAARAPRLSGGDGGGGSSEGAGRGGEGRPEQGSRRGARADWQSPGGGWGAHGPRSPAAARPGEGNSEGGGEGGGKDEETVSAAATAAAASLLPGKSRPLSLPAPLRGDPVLPRYRLGRLFIRSPTNHCSWSPRTRPSTPPYTAGGATYLPHTPIGGELPQLRPTYWRQPVDSRPLASRSLEKTRRFFATYWRKARRPPHSYYPIGRFAQLPPC